MIMNNGYEKGTIRKGIVQKALFLCFGFILLSRLTFAVQLNPIQATASLLDKSTDDIEHLVSVHFENEPLPDVLHELTRKVNVGISYDTQMVPPKLITYEGKNKSVYAVLGAALEGTGLYVTLSENRKVIVIKERLLQKAQQAQTGNLTGRVIDAETGDPMPGTNVYIEATGQGTSTDADGEFQIFDIERGTYEVSVTFIGYNRLVEEVEIIDGQTTEVEFELEQKRSQLDEVVVTGYGAGRRELPTGAVTTVQAEEFEVRSVQTLDQVIQAQSPGFRMVNVSGQPGGASYIRIRGIGSISAGNSPLFVVDGTMIEDSYTGLLTSTNPLASLNPSDIESVEVLRDAEATALYGAEGANGVVLITTKRGNAGATQFSVSSQVGIAEQTFEYDLMNGPEWVQFMQEVYANRYEDLGQTEYNGVDYENPREAGRQFVIDSYGHPDEVNTYDWQEATQQQGIQQRYSLSAQGGTDVTQFYISGGYNNQEGTFVGSSFDRMSLRANIDHQASDKLRFELNANIARSKTFGRGGEGGSNSTQSPWHGAVTTAVTTPIYKEDGSWNQDNIATVNYNTIQLLHEEERWTRRIGLIGNMSANYKITDNFRVRSRWGLNFRTVRDYRYRNPAVDEWEERGGYVGEHLREVTSWNTDQVLDYLNSFEEVHNVNAIFGAEYRRMYRSRFYARGRSLPNAYYFRTIDATAVNNSMGGTYGEYRKAGIFSRFTYNYDQRYYATVNVRYDGSSRFGENQRWGLFYSGSLAWDIAGESFMSNVDFVEELKPRISYGITGNSSIGYYAALNTFTTGGGAYGGGTPLRPGQLGNADLTWETARTIDIGLDWSLFEGQLYGFVDMYRKDNENLLLNRNLPTNSGYGSIADNVGTVRWEGVEAEIGGVLVDAGNFRWSSEFNITYERSEILELVDGQESISNTIRVGEPRLIQWGRYYAGVNPADGRPMWYDKDGNLTYTVNSSGGPNDDRGKIGSQLPDYYGGFKSRFSYGPVTVSALFHYEYGKDLRNYTHNVFMMRPHRGPRTLSRDMFDRWQQPGDLTEVPRAYSESSFPGSSTYNALSTLDMEDGSFIRLKNLVLQYQIPVKWADAIGIRGASIYAQGENLMTWTAFTGPDPEVQSQTQAIYPKPRTFMGGVTVDF